MKARHILGLAVLMAVAGSCKKNQNQDTSTFSASIEIDESNRTYLDGMKVRWSAGDPIIVYGNGDSQTYTLSQGAGDQTATFTTTGGVQPASTYRAFYPASSCRGVSGDVFTFSMPDTQTYTANGFMNNLNPMAGKNDGNGGTLIGFKNAFAILKLQTKGNRTVSKVEVTVPSGALYGNFTFDPTTGITTYVDGGGATITLDCSNSPVALNASTAQDFYIVLPPGCLSGGFEVKYYQESNPTTPFATTSVPSTANNLSLARNTIKYINLTANSTVKQVTNLAPAMTSAGWTVLGSNNVAVTISAEGRLRDMTETTGELPHSSQNPTGWRQAIRFTTNGSGETYVRPNPNSYTLVNGHQYYFRMYTHTQNYSGNTTYDLYFPVNINAEIHRHIRAKSAQNYEDKWQKHSLTFSNDVTSSSGEMRIDVNSNNVAVRTIGEVMLIDLTADYTNQGLSIPTNLGDLPYFTGSIDINESNPNQW